METPEPNQGTPEPNQGVETPVTGNPADNVPADTQPAEKKDEGAEEIPFKTFTTQADFDRHCAGILNNAKSKAEKELLAMLGLKPDEKDKLAKFKEAYDNTLSEAERQAKNLENLNVEVNTLRGQIAEKDAVIAALSQMTGKTATDVDKYVKMAKGLVDDNTTIEQALAQVLEFTRVEEKKTVPRGNPLPDPTKVQVDANPFKTGNLTEQGKLIRSDREKAREMYLAVYGKAPSW